MNPGAAYAPVVEAVLALAPPPVRSAIDTFEAMCSHYQERTGRWPAASAAQRFLLGALVRAGGTADDVRFLIVHGFAEPQDLITFRRIYPHRPGPRPTKETDHG